LIMPGFATSLNWVAAISSLDEAAALGGAMLHRRAPTIVAVPRHTTVATPF
jgi:hypothetical protein